MKHLTLPHVFILALLILFIAISCNPNPTNMIVMPETPDQNPLIPDDKPDENATLASPDENQINTIKQMHTKFASARESIEKNEFIPTLDISKTERIFNTSEVEIVEGENSMKIIVNGNLSLEEKGLKETDPTILNGSFDVTDNGQTDKYEAVNLSISGDDSSKLVFEGILKKNNNNLDNTQIQQAFNYILDPLIGDENITNMREMHFMQITTSSEGLTTKEAFTSELVVGETKTEKKENTTLAVIITLNKDTMKIGYKYSYENNSEIVDYIALNGIYLSVDECRIALGKNSNNYDIIDDFSITK